MFAIDSLRGCELNSLLSPLAPFLFSPTISFRFFFFLILCFSFCLYIYCFKGRSVNRSPPPTRGFGTAACARTRTQQRLLSAWCVMSERGRQQGKAMDIHYLLVSFAIAGPQGVVLWGPPNKMSSSHYHPSPSKQFVHLYRETMDWDNCIFF